VGKGRRGYTSIPPAGSPPSSMVMPTSHHLCNPAGLRGRAPSGVPQSREDGPGPPRYPCGGRYPCGRLRGPPALVRITQRLRARVSSCSPGPNGLISIGAKEALGPPPLSPSPRDVVASAAVAHQPDVPLCGSAPLPHGNDVIEPHRLLVSALDARPAVSPPHVHLHPRGGQRVPNVAGQAPMLQARISPVQGIVVWP
jgi:hypothetical protein